MGIEKRRHNWNVFRIIIEALIQDYKESIDHRTMENQPNETNTIDQF